MSTLSYGEEKPVASNRTRDGRAQNRRIVFRVLS
jgi:outer membrane protein OmpA-like peptidoglycan-associated protein